MTLRDARDLPVSTRRQASLDAFEDALQALHRYQGDPLGTIERTLQDDPGFVLGHVLRAALLLTATDARTVPDTRRSVEAAEALAADANDRERRLIAATRAWLDGDLRRASDLLAEAAVEHPRDALALQIGHLADYYLGDLVTLRDRIARALPEWSADVPGHPYVLGMYAFGLEECRDFAAAERVGRQAVALAGDDCWAIHAVAHVLEMQGRRDEGIEWLSSRSDDWAPDNFFAVHNWWHLALYYLDEGSVARVRELYDRAIAPRAESSILDLIDAAAMLWRLTLLEIDTGDRWQPVADGWLSSGEAGFYPFNDAHAAMAYVGAGRMDDARALLATLERRAGDRDTSAWMIREVGLPVCRALVDFGAERYEHVIDGLLPVRSNAHRFGGSNAQRDVLERTLLEAARRAGRRGLVRALENERALRAGDRLQLLVPPAATCTPVV